MNGHTERIAQLDLRAEVTTVSRWHHQVTVIGRYGEYNHWRAYTRRGAISSATKLIRRVFGNRVSFTVTSAALPRSGDTVEMERLIKPEVTT